MRESQNGDGKRPAPSSDDGPRSEAKRPHRDAAEPLPGAGSPAAAEGAAGRKHMRKIALVIAYNGRGYSGLQRNPNVKAVEDDVLAAAAAAGRIPLNLVHDLKALWYCRCARTDKGVHALANVLSFKCHLANDEPPEGVAAQINAHLPAGLLALATRRTARSFDAHRHCDSREYDYLLPAGALRCPSAGRVVGAAEPAAAHDAPLSEAELRAVDRLLAAFVGTLNFHNYTHGLAPAAPQAKRHILSARVVAAPSLRGLPYVALRFKGASFLLNQIRKMAAVTLARARGLLDDGRFAQTLSARRVPVIIAPASGLMLRSCAFDHYDQTHGSDPRTSGGKLGLTPAEEAASEAFCVQHVLPDVGSDENAAALAEWLEQLHKFDFARDLDDEPAVGAAQVPALG